MSFDVKAFLARERVPQACCLVLAVWMMWQLYLDVRAYVALQHQQSVPMKPSNSHLNALQKGLSVGLTTKWFGDYVSKGGGEVVVKQSLLHFKVVGIMVMGKKGQSHVILSAVGEEEREYHVGDTLPGGAVIKKIMQDGLLIEYHGELERLDLPKNPLLFEPPSKKLEHSH